jgi:hypothetical protein
MNFRRAAIATIAHTSTRASRARELHVPLAVVLPHVLRQGDHHALDLPKPHSIAAVPNVCVRPPTCAHEVFEINAGRVDAIHEFSSSRHVASDADA